LARAAGPRLVDFNVQALANTAWAFVTAGQLDGALSAALTRSAVPRLDEFDAQALAAGCWAFSRRENLTDAWSLVEHATRTDSSFTTS